MSESQVRWDQIVESDQIQGKNGKWYEVTLAVGMGNGMVKIRVQGVAAQIIRPASETTAVRRGATGQAVDVIKVVFSGPSMHTQKGE